eukprot:366039-Chlamydomonas_euryale.AAC.24
MLALESDGPSVGTPMKHPTQCQDLNTCFAFPEAGVPLRLRATGHACSTARPCHLLTWCTARSTQRLWLMRQSPMSATATSPRHRCVYPTRCWWCLLWAPASFSSRCGP